MKCDREVLPADCKVLPGEYQLQSAHLRRALHDTTQGGVQERDAAGAPAKCYLQSATVNCEVLPGIAAYYLRNPMVTFFDRTDCQE